MLDLGWQEFFLIALVALLIVGPKDLPNVIRTVTRGIRKVRGLAREFQNSVEEVAREAELDDIRKQAKALASTDISSTIRDTVDPDGSMMNSIQETRVAVEETNTIAATGHAAGPRVEAPARSPATEGPPAVDAVPEPEPGAAGRSPTGRGRAESRAARLTPRTRTAPGRAAAGSVRSGSTGTRSPSTGPLAAGPRPVIVRTR